MEHPHPAAFEAARENARKLIEKIAVGMGEADEAVYDYDYARRVEEIESEARPGFWPWTSGGFEVTLPAALSHHWGTGSAPAPVEPMIEAGNRFLAEAWAEEYPDRPGLIECITADADTPAAQFQDEAAEWEEEGWDADGDAYFWKARAMFLAPGDPSFDHEEAPDGGPYVFIDAYLNTDLNYGRDSIRWMAAYGRPTDQTTGAFKRAIPVDRFAALDEAALDALAEEAVKSLP